MLSYSAIEDSVSLEHHPTIEEHARGDRGVRTQRPESLGLGTMLSATTHTIVSRSRLTSSFVAPSEVDKWRDISVCYRSVSRISLCTS